MLALGLSSTLIMVRLRLLDIFYEVAYLVKQDLVLRVRSCMWALRPYVDPTVLLTGTKVQGFQKRELSDVWVPAQLWVISQVGDDPIYTIQNANSRTYMTLSGCNATATNMLSARDAHKTVYSS